MKPAPPVTRSLGNVCRLVYNPGKAIQNGRRSFPDIGRLVEHIGGAVVDNIGRLVVESEQIARGIDNTQSAAVRGSSFEPNAWLVQKLVHQRFRKMFDCFCLLS